MFDSPSFSSSAAVNLMGEAVNSKSASLIASQLLTASTCDYVTTYYIIMCYKFLIFDILFSS